MVARYYTRQDDTLVDNPVQNRRSAAPRHREINDHLARKICRDLGVKKPKRQLTRATGSNLTASSLRSHFGRRRQAQPNLSLVFGRCEIMNTQAIAKHIFCSYCGIKSFYVPRSHPEGISVNARCLDAWSLEVMTTKGFYGRNWEKRDPRAGRKSRWSENISGLTTGSMRAVWARRSFEAAFRSQASRNTPRRKSKP